MATRKKSDFESLKDEWYAKLKADGFEDIEQDEQKLKLSSSRRFGHARAQFHSGGWEAKASYYQMAGRFADEYRFETELQKVIWTYHASGLNYREIAETLKAAGIKKVSHVMAHRIVGRLKLTMFSMYMIPVKEYYE